MNSVVHNTLLHWDHAFHTFVKWKTHTASRSRINYDDKLYRHPRGVIIVRLSQLKWKRTCLARIEAKENMILISKFPVYGVGPSYSVGEMDRPQFECFGKNLICVKVPKSSTSVWRPRWAFWRKWPINDCLPLRQLDNLLSSSFTWSYDLALSIVTIKTFFTYCCKS